MGLGLLTAFFLASSGDADSGGRALPLLELLLAALEVCSWPPTGRSAARSVAAPRST